MILFHHRAEVGCLDYRFQHRTLQGPMRAECDWHKIWHKGAKSGAPVGIRTQDILLRRQMLYPTELRAQTFILQCF